jgi:Acetyltransferase (GNAT) domain
MQVFLETRRLALRRFTMADVDNLISLDAEGYATEGSRALIRKGFTELGVRRVVAETMVVNVASRRVMEKAGLTLVRTFHAAWPYRIEGGELGDVEYALDRADWEGRQRAGQAGPGMRGEAGG